MTLETTIVEESFPGTGSTVLFDTAIQAFVATEVFCYLQKDSTLVYSQLVLNTDYTVANLEHPDGVEVTLAVAPAVGYTLIIQRTLPIKQTMDIQNQGGFNPEVLERELDRIVAMVQQVDRNARSSIGRLWDTGPELFLFNEDGYLYYDASEGEIYNVQSDPSGGSTVQVTPPEITAGTETELRSYSPANIVQFITEHAPASDYLTNVAQDRIVGRVSAGSGNSEELTAAQVRTLLNVENGAQVNTVTSVNAATGVVVLDPDDLDDTATLNKFISQAELDKLAGIESGAQVNDVASVNGFIGAVVLDPDDLDDALTTNKFISAAELTKLSGIETGATADQTASEIKTAYESNADTNAFTDALLGKLNGIETGAEVNAVDSVNGATGVVVLDPDDLDDTSTLHKFASAAELSKLAGIETGATADQTGAEIKVAYEGEANTNAFTDAEQTKLAGIASGAQVNTVDSVNSLTGAVVLDPDDLDDTSSLNKFISAAELTKLGGIETAADVTDTANVTAAGALMDSELTSLSGIKTLTVPDSTTISAFGATLVDDADASAARTTLGLGTIATQDIAALTASLLPNVDNAIALGSLTKRYSDVWAASGTFATMLAGFMGAGDGGTLPTLAGGTAGVVANTSGASDWTSFSILAGNTGQSSLFFGDTDAEIRGYLKYNHSSDELVFGAGNTDNYKISSTNAIFGSYNIGSASGQGVSMDITGTMVWQRPSTTGVAQKVLRYVRGTTEEFIVRSDGDVENTNNSYGAISDARLKENMRAAKSQWADVLAAELFNYNRIGREDKHLGFSAQQLEKAGIKGPVSESEDGFKAVAYSIMYLKAFGALQEAMQRIEALEAQVWKMQ